MHKTNFVFKPFERPSWCAIGLCPWLPTLARYLFLKGKLSGAIPDPTGTRCSCPRDLDRLPAREQAIVVLNLSHRLALTKYPGSG